MFVAVSILHTIALYDTDAHTHKHTHTHITAVLATINIESFPFSQHLLSCKSIVIITLSMVVMLLAPKMECFAQ